MALRSSYTIKMRSYLYTFVLATLCCHGVGANVDSTTPLSTQLRAPRGFENIHIQKFVNLDSFEGTIAGVELTCEQTPNGKIGFCGGDCTDQVGGNQGANVSQECATFLNSYVSKCLEQIGCASSAAFCGAGGHAKRNINNGQKNSTPSRHSTGDAIDVFGLRCKGRSGEAIKLDFNTRAYANPPVRKKYDQFLSCWRSQIAAYNAKAGIDIGGAISCEGSPPPNNDLHNDHIHLSCPVMRKNVAKI